jgi:uncharacterized membrane protein
MNTHTPGSKISYAFVLSLMLATYVFSVLIPPFQAPDEFEHLKRAYMFSQGQIVLHSVDGSASGGNVDSGLMQYMSHFEPLKGAANRKISQDEMKKAGEVRWSNSNVFETPSGSGSYFPALYAPAAAGLLTGKVLNLSVQHSYRLARIFTLLACAALLFLALRICQPPLAALAIMALPMLLFLSASPVLDGTATATFLVAMSSFARICRDREGTPDWVFHTLVASIALVAACRANMLPMLALPLAASIIGRKRKQLVIAIIAATLVCAWTVITVKTTVYPATARHTDNAGRLVFFATHPGAFLEIIYNTVSNPARTSFYGYSFVGILGWLDAPLAIGSYYTLALLLLLSVIISIGFRSSMPVSARLLIVACVLGSILLTFLALLVQWTPDHATEVDGIQGRYFLMPAIALMFAIAGTRTASKRRLSIEALLLTALFAASTSATASTLLHRYLQPITQQDRSDVLSGRMPSPPLAADHPIPVVFSQAQVDDPAKLSSLGIKLGTYMTTHAGTAEVRLEDAGGHSVSRSFELKDLVDNGFLEIPLDGGRYIKGEISSTGGVGISTWEVKVNKRRLSCLHARTTDGREITTPGCD